MEPDMHASREALRELEIITLGVISNRRREFMSHEIAAVDGDGWHICLPPGFAVTMCHTTSPADCDLQRLWATSAPNR